MNSIKPLRLVVVLFLIAFLAMTAFLVPVYAGTVKILNVEAKKIGNYNEVIVYTSENIRPEVILLESPNRIALAFPNSRIDSPLTIAGPSSMIRIIQAMQFDENTVYVMVEPNEKLAYEYASIIGRNKYILELSAARPGSAKVVAPSIIATTEAEKVQTPEVIVALPKELTATPEAAQISAEVTLSAEAIKPIQKAVSVPLKKTPKVEISKIVPAFKGRTIVIDPGHGGRDPGYVGKSGILEKFLNLKIAQKLKVLLADAGAKVIMTRENDVSTKDKDIVGIANRNNADIFIAIHLNSYTSTLTGGCETYYFTPQSKRLAQVIQRNLSQTLKRRNRGIKRVTYYTIHHAKMPAVLLEPIYLTNTREEKLILDPQFQARVAYGIYKGLKEYVKISQHGGNIKRKEYSVRKGSTKDPGNNGTSGAD